MNCLFAKVKTFFQLIFQIGRKMIKFAILNEHIKQLFI
jgi:hypothetical protein